MFPPGTMPVHFQKKSNCTVPFLPGNEQKGTGRGLCLYRRNVREQSFQNEVLLNDVQRFRNAMTNIAVQRGRRRIQTRNGRIYRTI
jgi:hypothetical protein